MAKDFSGIKTDRVNQNTGKVFNATEQAITKKGQQGTASAAEIKERQSKLKTQGRKGAKAERINMAFTPENKRFIKLYASSTGQTMTQACNEMIEYARTDPKFLEKAKAGIDSLFIDLETAAKEEK